MLNQKNQKQFADDKKSKGVQRIDSGQVDSSVSNNQSNLLNKKRGIANKIENRIGSDVSSYHEFDSKDGERKNFKVDQNDDVNFGSDNDNHWTDQL